jgi:purine-binding chemotaxis protein CheW
MAGAASTQAAEDGIRHAKAGKHFTFQLGEELYGVEILKVQEIIGLMPVTRVPRAPEFARGVINLRGRIIPVMDLRRKFGMEPRDDTDRTCIVVVQVFVHGRPVTAGVLVDEVSEVVDVQEEQIEEPPSLGLGEEAAFVRGMAKIGQKVVMLLDVDRVFSQDDTTMADALMGQA